MNQHNQTNPYNNISPYSFPRESSFSLSHQSPSINFSFLKQKLLFYGVFSQSDFTYGENSQSSLNSSTEETQNNFNSNSFPFFNWKETDKYFFNFTEGDLMNIFNFEIPFSCATESEHSINNDTVYKYERRKEYKLSCLQKGNEKFYIIHDVSSLKESDFNLNNKQHLPECSYLINNEKKRAQKEQKMFLNKKRAATSFISNSEVVLKDIVELNSLSSKIINLERLAINEHNENDYKNNYSNNTMYKKEKDYIDKELSLKNKMLSLITKINSKTKNMLIHNIYDYDSTYTSLNYSDNQQNTPLHYLYLQVIYINILNKIKSSLHLIEIPPNIFNYITCKICFNILDDNNKHTYTSCSNCNETFHNECNGRLNKTTDNTTLCDICIFKLKTNNTAQLNYNIKCFICGKNQGLLKHSNNNKYKWYHVICVLLSNYFMFKDYSSLDKVENLAHVSQGCTFLNKCVYCNSKGECFKCKTCNKLYHLLCAFLLGFKMKIEYVLDYNFPKNKKGTLVIVECKYCVSNYNNGVIDLNKRAKIRSDLFYSSY